MYTVNKRLFSNNTIRIQYNVTFRSAHYTSVFIRVIIFFFTKNVKTFSQFFPLYRNRSFYSAFYLLCKSSSLGNILTINLMKYSFFYPLIHNYGAILSYLLPFFRILFTCKKLRVAYIFINQRV